MNIEQERAFEQILHSVQQAQIPGNDWRRELKLIESTCRAALQSQDREDAIEEGFRWRSINPPYKIWNYVWDRAPDSWELREAEIQNVVVYARRVEGEGE